MLGRIKKKNKEKRRSTFQKRDLFLNMESFISGLLARDVERATK